jgi:RimJ/RimL family protein N-acetyltransferase
MVACAAALWGRLEVAPHISAGGKSSEDAAGARFAAKCRMQAEHGVQYWPIFLQETGQYAGCCGLRPYRPADEAFALHIHLRPRGQRGKLI